MISHHASAERANRPLAAARERAADSLRDIPNMSAAKGNGLPSLESGGKERFLLTQITRLSHMRRLHRYRLIHFAHISHKDKDQDSTTHPKV